jgi:hypothetical protein
LRPRPSTEGELDVVIAATKDPIVADRLGQLRAAASPADGGAPAESSKKSWLNPEHAAAHHVQRVVGFYGDHSILRLGSKRGLGHNAGREQLMGVRSFVDFWIARIDEADYRSGRSGERETIEIG